MEVLKYSFTKWCRDQNLVIHKATPSKVDNQSWTSQYSLITGEVSSLFWESSSDTVKLTQMVTSTRWPKMTNADSTQDNSHTIVTVYDNHLSNMTSNFFVSQMKKTFIKQPLHNLPSKEMGNKHKSTMHKK